MKVSQHGHIYIYIYITYTHIYIWNDRVQMIVCKAHMCKAHDGIDGTNGTNNWANDTMACGRRAEVRTHYEQNNFVGCFDHEKTYAQDTYLWTIYIYMYIIALQSLFIYVCVHGENVCQTNGPTNGTNAYLHI